MRHRLLATVALGATLTLAPLMTASNAFADESTVTPDQCFSSGGFFGGYDSTGHAFCLGGPYDGMLFDKDPLQGPCADGYHLTLVYLGGWVCSPNIP